MQKILYSFFFIILSLTGFSQKTVSINEFIKSPQISTFGDENNVKAAHTISATPTQVSCFGVCDGSIVVDVTGGPPTYPINIRLRFPADLGGGEVWVNGLIATDFPYTITNLCGSGSPYEVRTRDGDNTWSNNLNSIYVLAPAALDVIEIIVDETCPGTCDGSITLDEVNGGTMPYVFAWSNGPSTENIASLCAGNYTLTLTDDHACVETFTFPITAPPVIVIDSLVYDSVFCFGGSGSVTVYASGGTPPYQYDIGSGYVAGNTFSGLAAGTYNITVQDFISCFGNTGNFRFYENTAMSISGVVTHIQCFGNTNGAINTSVLGGVGPYTYSWTGTAFTSTLDDISGLSAGTYDVTVTDIYGCTTTNSFTVNEPTAIILNETHIVPCFGASNGSINLTVSGGTIVPCGGYTFIWSNAAITEDLNNIPQGNYTVTVTDCNSCTATLTINIVQNPQITIAFARTHLPCFSSGCVGAINLTAGGGTPIAPPPAYTYSWTGPAAFTSTNEDITNLCIGTYWVTVTDALGCTRALSTTITRPTDITINQVSITPLTCNGVCVGAIDINPTGGTPGYTYNWSGPSFSATTQDVTGLCAGNYTVTVTDSRGCTKTRLFTITQPLAVTVNAVLSHVSCNGGSNGSIDITVTNAIAPVSYSWTGPAFSSTSADIAGLVAGTYNLTITSAGPCELDTSFTITEPTAIAPTITAQVDVSCFGLCDGSATVTPGGGTPPYTYLWCNAQTTPIATGLCAGICNVTVTDANLCTATTAVTITQPADIVLTPSHTDALCNGQCNGTGTIIVTSGGTAPFDYIWCNAQITATASGLCTGPCGVTVTDDNGCTATSAVNIGQPVALTATIGSQTNVSCFGVCDGAATVNGAGGTLPYSYEWCGGQAVQSPNNLCDGICGVTITDANNCTATNTVTITEPAVLIANIPSQTNITCNGLCNGAATASATGGTAPYTYSWSTGATGINVGSLCAGEVCVTVSDAHGCTSTFCVTITEPPLLTATLDPPTNITCFGLCDGSATVTAGGGTPGYTYLWCNGQTTPTATGLCVGPCGVTITDSQGCTASDIINITQPNAIVLNTTQTDALCNGQCNGTGTVNVTSGGTAPFDYVWCNAQITATATGLCTGPCGVTVTDVNGCTATSAVNIGQPVALTATIGSQTNVSCFGVCDGAATVNGAGGTLPYSYEWCGGQAVQSPNNLCDGICGITITDANNCTATNTVTITEPTVLIANIPSQTNITCNGLCNGAATASAAGGTAPYTYSWSTGATGINVGSLCAGEVCVTVSDAHGCTSTFCVTITEPPLLTATLDPPTNITCFGLCDGSATVTAGGGTPGYTYLWCNGQTTPTATGLCVGPCGVTITDSQGCTASDIITITQPNAIVLNTTQTDALCNGHCNGTATVTVTSGGTAPYTYLWSCGAQTTATATGLCDGVCQVTVTDFFGCTATISVTILEPTILTANNGGSTDMTCSGTCDGTGTITVVGGTPNYTYAWPNGEITNPAIALCVGSYVPTVTDQNGCTVESAPFTISSPPALVASITDSTMSCGSFNTQVAGTTYLPDGTGVSYTSTIPQSDFAAGLNITNANQIVSICANMEHSYLGDLNITLTCPNGQNIILKQYPGGGGTYLGEPIDQGPHGDQQFPGIGYDYCWSMNPIYGTMVSEANSHYQSYTDAEGYNYPNAAYLPSGSYLPIQDFTGLVGCPVNGDWTITVTDNLGIDNGFIFSWLINFAPSIYPNQFCNGTITTTASGGTAPYDYFWSNGAITPNLTDLCEGSYCVTITDAVGCTATDCSNIIDVDLIITSMAKTDASCNGICNGTATVNYSINGGIPVIYEWSTGATTQTINNLCAGWYYVTVSEADGCFDTDSIEITNAYNLTSIFTETTPILCNGDCTGAGYFGNFGGTSPYTFSWSPNITDIDSIVSGLCAGKYFITITDNPGCIKVDSVTFVQPTLIQIDPPLSTDITCIGNNDGTITITASGGTGTLTYTTGALSNTTGLFTGLSANTYIVTVTDDNNCTAVTAPITISDPTPIIVTDTTIVNVVPCAGDNSGSITIVVSGGNLPYLFDIGSGNQALPSFNGLLAGTYDITITDASGCTITTGPLIVTEPTALTSVFTEQVMVTCGGGCNGILTITPAGGVQPYTYNWSPNTMDTDSTVSSLCAAMYFVTITDALGCTTINNAEIADVNAFDVDTIRIDSITCFGVCNGEIEVLATGTNPPFDYLWSDNQTGPIATGLCVGNISLTITDNNLCQRFLTFNLTEPSGITLDTDTINNTCFNSCDGSAIVIANGGTLPYTFIWDDPAGQTNDIATNLCAGDYTVTVTDQNGCSSVSLPINISEPTQITSVITEDSPISCNGICDGAITIAPAGGTGTYTYIWSPNVADITASITGLCAVTYDVTVTDTNLCTHTNTYTISEPSVLTATMTDSTAVSCGGICTGTATVTAAGGTPGYDYLWDNQTGNQTTPVATALCQGIFFVTITDQHGCTAFDQVTIVDTSNLALDTVSVSPPSCFGQCDGAAEVLATGGYPPYTYTWSNPPGGVNPVVNGLCEGTFFVTVTDDSLCARTLQLDIIAPQALTATFDSLNPLCTGNCNGWISVDVTGGTAPYTYLWDDPAAQTTDSITGLCAGMYHVTITDLNSCAMIDSVELTGPVALTTSIAQNSPVICYNECNGAIAAVPAGGTPLYTYLWTGGLTDSLITGICAGTYDLTITDANGCTITDNFTLTNPDTLEILFTNIIQIPCGLGNCTGEATVTPTGGIGPYTYLWDANAGSSINPTVTSLCGGIYFVTVTDANLCSQIGMVEITDTSDLALNIMSVSHISCGGSCDGEATVDATGGYPPYTYTWSTVPIQTGPIATGLCQGTYFVTVTDDSLCARFEMIEITDAAVLTATTVVTPITCSGRCDAEIAIVPSGGTLPIVSYEWSIVGLTDSIATLLCPDWYYFTITDSHNCTFVDSVEVVDPGNFIIDIDILSPIVCAGECSGSLEANPQTGIPPIQYLWDNNSTDSLLTNLCAGDYIVTVTDASGCSASASYTLIQPDTLEVTLTNMVNVACGGDCSGSLTITANGGVIPYDYLWDINTGSATTPVVTLLCANLYFVTVTDDNGCSVVFNTELTDTSHLELLALDSSMVTCYGMCNGEIMVDASGGYLPYNFVWNTTPAETNDTITNLCAGQYIVTVTDDSLCSRVRLFDITQPDSLYLTLIDSLGLNCFGECTGMLSVTATGGTPNYNYLWSGTDITPQISNLCANLYSVTLTDANGCTDTLSRQITEPPQINANLTVTNSLCSSGSGDGAIQSAVTGGTLPIDFLWSNDSTTQNITNLNAGWYFLTLTDAQLCQVIDSAEVVPGIIVDALAWKDTIICGHDSIQIFGFGSTIFTWTPTTGMNNPLVFNPWVSPGVTTTYFFTAYDSICFDIDSVTIGAYAPLNIDAGPDETILYDHPTQITGSGGTTGTTFEWVPATGLENPNALTTSSNPESTTTYYLIATDENGCIEMDSLIITVIPRIVVPTGFTPNGDGMNDDWEIDMIHLYPNCEIEVYNRWGEQLFYSLGYPASERFDGTYKGKDLPIGTYYYIINLHDEIFTEPITGPLTIMR